VDSDVLDVFVSVASYSTLGDVLAANELSLCLPLVNFIVKGHKDGGK